MARANRHDQIISPPTSDTREKRSIVNREEHDATKENKVHKQDFAQQLPV